MNALLRLAPLLLCLCLPGVAARAADVGGLFDAAVPVSGQGAGERARAVQEGFRQVLVKASGQRSVLALPALQAELGKGDALLGSFKYESQPRPGGSAPLLLRLSFHPASVRAILNRAGAPVWGASRPPVYLWVVREGGGGRSLLGFGTPAADVLLEAAGARGLPALLPAAGEVPVTDAPLATVPPAVADAATRAGARAVLAAAVTGNGGRHRAAGVLSIEGVAERIEAAGADEGAALRELVQVAADRLGARYAMVARPDQLQAVRLRVAGIGSLEDHAALERWLAGLPLVKDLVLVEVGPRERVFMLTLAGSIERFRQAMATDGRLTVGGEPVVEDTTTVIEAGWTTATP